MKAQNELKYDPLFEALPFALFTYSKGHLISCNSMVSKLFGYDQAFFENSLPFKYSPEQQPDGMPSVLKAQDIIKKLQVGFVQNFEWTFCKKNGDCFFAEVTLSAFSHADGNQLQYSIAIHDISKYKKSELEISSDHANENTDARNYRNEGLYKQVDYIFNHSTDAIGIIELQVNEYILTSANAQFIQLLHVGRTPLSLVDWLPKKIFVNFRRLLNDAMQKKDVLQHEEAWVIDQRKLALNILLIPVIKKEITTKTVACFIRDVTANRKLEYALKESESHLHATVENLPFDFWSIDAEGKYTYQNEVSLQKWGSLIGKTLDDCTLPVGPHFRSVWNDCNNRVLKGEEIREEVTQEIDGASFYYLSIYTPIRIDEKIIGAVGVNIDITAQKEAEQKIRASEEKFRDLFNADKDVAIITSFNRTFLAANESFYKYTGLNKDDLQTRPMLDMFPAQYHFILQSRLKQLVTDGHTPAFECEVRGKDGQYVPVELSSVLINYDNQPAVLSHAHDISARKKLEKRIFDVTLEIEERERRKLASDLHDEIGPLLSSMNMYLSSLARKPELEKYNQLTGNIIRILKEAIGSIREISNNISPHLLVNFGLHAATNAFFDTKRNLIPINFDSNIEKIRFPENVEVLIYRILKEAFNNTIKYAQATCITVNIKLEENKLNISYIDDGIGFELAGENQQLSTGLGLVSIVDRVKNLSGTYQINTAPGKGFELLITITLQDNGQDRKNKQS